MIYGVRTWGQVGDNSLLTGAVHNVKVAHPEFLFSYVDNMKAFWCNNPDVVSDPPDKVLPIVHYGSLYAEQHASYGTIVEGFTRTLCLYLNIPLVPIVTKVPYLILSDSEKEYSKQWNNVWLLNASRQTCSFSKGYPFWQEVVDGLLDHIQIVQVGSKDPRNISRPLSGCIDFRGKSENLRQYIAMIYGCAGIISPPSSLVNIGSTFNKKGVVLTGARELPALTAYSNMIHITSKIERCKCGKDKGCIALYDSGDRGCTYQVKRNGAFYSRCMTTIPPSQIISAVKQLIDK